MADWGLPHPGITETRAAARGRSALLDTLLRESKLGLYDMKHCTLRMIRKVTFETVSEPNITAECTIDWISFIFNDPDLQAATGIPGMEAM